MQKIEINSYLHCWIAKSILISIISKSKRSAGVEPTRRSYRRAHSRSHCCCCFSALAVYSTSLGQRKTQGSCRSGRGGGRLPTRAAKANERESALARLWKLLFFFFFSHHSRGKLEMGREIPPARLADPCLTGTGCVRNVCVCSRSGRPMTLVGCQVVSAQVRNSSSGC